VYQIAGHIFDAQISPQNPDVSPKLPFQVSKTFEHPAMLPSNAINLSPVEYQRKRHEKNMFNCLPSGKRLQFAIEAMAQSK